MCLYSKTGKFEVAEKDLDCYKVVCKSKFVEFDEFGFGDIPWIQSPIKKFFKRLRRTRYFTPYQQKKVTNSVIKGNENLIAEGNERIEDPRYNWNNTYSVSEGFIHSFSGLSTVLTHFANASLFMSRDGKVYELYKCIIPKGTKYIYGVDSDGVTSYASKEIKFVEKIAERLIEI